MARFVELKSELPEIDHSQWIDAKKVDAFTINRLDMPWQDAYVVQFRSGGRVLGAAFLYGEDRARAYALGVVKCEENPL